MSQTYELGIRITADGRLLAAEVKRGQESIQQLGATAQQAGAQASAALGGIGNAADQLNGQLNRTSVSAAQTAAALRGVPAQFTDIVTSLASGQAPLTVLIQQGGQLKDSFGGVVPAAKALGGYVAGLVNPLTVSAAAAAMLGAAFFSARSESDEFRKNLILTGNVSGMTAEKFGNMSRALGELPGITRGAAADALTEMAASGSISAASMQRLTAAALQLERAGGPAVAETVSQFEALGKKPVEASIELNSKAHYLTLAVYEQVKALEDQGKTSEAAAVAQKAWADAIGQRVPKMVRDLGYLETAWDKLKRSAAGTWDFLKGLGRDAPQAEQIVSLRQKIADADKSIGAGSINSNRLIQQKAQWTQELQALQANLQAKEKAAADFAAGQEKNDRRIAANVAADKLIDAQRSKGQKYTDALKKLDAQRSEDLVSDEKYRQSKAALQKKYEDKSGGSGKSDAQKEAERQQQRLNDLLAVGSGVSKNYTDDVSLLSRALQSGKINSEQYAAAFSKLWLTQTDAGKAFEASADAADKAAKALKVWQAEHQSQLAALAEETGAIGQSTEARKIAVALLQVDADARKKIEQLNLALSESARLAAADEINAERDKQKALLDTALRKKQAIDGAWQLEQDNRRFAADAILDEQQRARAILDIEAETWQQRIELAAAGSSERQRLESAFQQWYANQLSKPAIESMRKTIESIDSAFHDGFTRMLEQGKADWTAFSKSLANTFKTLVADQIYKMTFGKLIANVADAFVGNSAGSAAGQAGPQSGFGMLSGLQSAYAAYNGGITNAASTFATSGVGQYLGLSTTTTAGAMGPPTAAGAYGYTAGTTQMTSAGSSFVSSAGPYAAAIAALLYGQHLQKSGWGPDNDRKGNSAVAAGAAAGAAVGSYVPVIGTAIGAVIGAVAAPIWDRLFGHNRNTSYDAAGITGRFNLEGFEGKSYQDKSRQGGAFRSDKRWTDYNQLDSDLDAFLDSLMRQTVAGVQSTAKALGLETEKAVQGYVHTFQLQLTENGNWSKATDQIAGELGKVSDELATRLLPNIADFQRYGETASQTLARLNAEFQGTDAILHLLGKTAGQAFGAAGLASADARERLIDYAGGMDQLAAKTASFSQHYFTEEERRQQAAASAQQQINDAFAALNIAVPKSTAEFRKLVTGQDLSTEAGARLINQLLNLEGAFYTAQQATDAAAQTAAEQAAAVTRQARETAQGQQASLFDTFASDTQKLGAAQQLVADTFAGLGQSIPANAAAFLTLAQSADASSESGQALITALGKVSNAFAYTQTAAEQAAAATRQARETAQGQQASLFDAFATDAQKLGAAQQLVADTFAGLGQSIPANAAAFLTLAQSADTSSQSGQALLAALTGVKDAFNTVQTAAKNAAGATDALSRANQAAQDWFATLDKQAGVAKYASDGQAAIDLLFGAVQDGAQTTAQSAAAAAREAANAWRTAAASMRQTLDDIRTGPLSGLSPEARYQALQSQFGRVSAAAQHGDQAAAGQLSGLAQQFLQSSQQYYASSQGYQQDRSSVEAALQGSLDYAGAQAALQDSLAQASQDAVDELKRLNTNLSGFAAEALQMLRQQYAGADQGTAQAAVANLARLQADMDQWLAGSKTGDQKTYAGGSLTRLDGSNAMFTDAAGQASWLRAGQDVLDMASHSGALADYWRREYGLNLAGPDMAAPPGKQQLPAPEWLPAPLALVAAPGLGGRGDELQRIADHTGQLDQRIAAALAPALAELQAQIAGLTRVQARAAESMQALTEQTNRLLDGMARAARLESA